LLGFPVYPVADVRRIREVSERYAASLAAGLLARRQEIETVLPSCCAPGVDERDAAFIVLGCVSLDWDGLALAAKKGYRTMQKRPDGRYGAWAQEKSDLSWDRIYWSSGTPSYRDALLVSFGDGHAGYLSGLSNPPAPLQAPRASRYATKCLLALRDGERSLDELGSALGMTSAETQSLMGLLVDLEFVTQQNDRYRAHIPVFSRKDHKAVQQLRRIGNEVMAQWLADNYKKLQSDLSFTAPARWGVPYTEEFNAIWHYVFGLANRQLVEAGLFGDPYAPPRQYPGGIPAVFENSVL
jgi:biotin operon repressor